MKNLSALLAFGACLVFAGPNQNAVLSVDLYPGTTPSDSTLSISKDNGNFMLVIRASQTVGLDSYGFEIGFDSSLLTFVQADASSPSDGLPNFLESLGGTPLGFVGRVSTRDSTRISIAHSLTGSDSAQSPSGAGILAVLRFQPRGVAGDAVFSIQQPQLLDWRLQLDTAMATLGARLTLTTAVTIARNGRVHRSRLFTTNVLVVSGRRDLLGRKSVLIVK